MNIKMPNCEFKNVLANDCVETWSEDELILYFQRENKIVVMNETATIIWRCIINNIAEAKALISMDDFVTSIKVKCFDEVPSDACIIDDIVEIVNMFFSNHLIEENGGRIIV